MQRTGYFVAPGPGFEPGLEASKAPVLPLNDPGTQLSRISVGGDACVP